MSLPSFPKPPAPRLDETDNGNAQEIVRIEKQIGTLVRFSGDDIDGQISQLVNKAGILYSQTSSPGERSTIKDKLLGMSAKFRTAAIAAKGDAKHPIPAHDKKHKIPALRTEANDAIEALRTEAATGAQNRFNEALARLKAEIKTYDLLEETP